MQEDHSYQSLNIAEFSHRVLLVLECKMGFQFVYGCCSPILIFKWVKHYCQRSSAKTGSSLLIKKPFNEYPTELTNLLNLSYSHVVSSQFQERYFTQLKQNQTGRCY